MRTTDDRRPTTDDGLGRALARAKGLSLLGALALMLALLTPTVARAHPLGNFTVNHYSRIEPAGDGVRVVYVLDLAEIPTFQEQPRIDLDRDGQFGESERELYADRRAEELRGNLRLGVDGAPAALRLVERSLSFPPGQGGLPTLRLEAVYAADLPNGRQGPIVVTYRNDNNLDRLGWREIVARPGAAGTRIHQASVPADDRSDALRSYPEDLLSSPLDVREAHLTFEPGGAAAGPIAGLGGRAGERGEDVYASLAAAGGGSLPHMLFYLGVALLLGAQHALSPGHGKTVVAAYLIGSRGTARHALFLGLTVTATHTLGVYALGLVTLFLSQYILPEQLYPPLQILSGMTVVGIGAWLFVTRLRAALVARRSVRSEGTGLARDAALVAHAHEHANGHAHDHDDAHGHGHEHDHTNGHGHADADAIALAPARAGAATVVGYGHDRGHARDHDHPHAHDRSYPHDHDHAHGDAHDHGHADAHDPAHTTALVHSHGDGGPAHSHLPPGADGEAVTWRSLLALGVSGGLLPCPSALVVLLSAIALHQVAFGLLLIVAFSIGLAAVLVGIGLLLVYARRFFERFSFGGGLVTRLLPVASALVVVVAGLLITAQALPRTL